MNRNTNTLTSFALVLAVFAVACDSSTSPTPLPPESKTPPVVIPLPPPVALTPVVTSVYLIGPVIVLVGDRQRFELHARFDDGTDKNVSAQSIWASSAPPFAEVSVDGIVRGISPGDPQISANYEGTVDALRIAVR